MENTFIIIEAILSENGVFKLIRAFEDKNIPRITTQIKRGEEAGIFLYDKNKTVIFQKEVSIVFNYGCDSKSLQMGSAPFMVAIPRMENAIFLSVIYQNHEVYKEAIGTKIPTLNHLTVNVKDDIAILKLKSSLPVENLTVFAKLEDNTCLRTPTRVENNQLLVDCKPLKGYKNVRFIVEATHLFRTNRLESKPIKLPQAEFRGTIVEPFHDVHWPFGKIGSLIASVYLENGNRLAWNEGLFKWKINGKILKESNQLTTWSPKKSGNYKVELVQIDQEEKQHLLDSINVKVLNQTNEQKEYQNLLKKLNL